ncbi:hypothetical protein [Arthrobacter sp. ISL-28]|uniref:hypothetical protein n=1 Tax=Arthrobacter sp. ISL-28 TaxID=2819108 RepID=UPI001BE8F49E|nr:hypothetical protein [Arthrobacter sp. ISL-28]MBT2523054.1 hypothetical protein [Arthrobacter sp. ISL-28]
MKRWRPGHSLIVLALLFLVATVRSVNMGVLAFVAAFAVGVPVAGMTTKEVIAGFPGELFLVLMGLTFLFGYCRYCLEESLARPLTDPAGHQSASNRQYCPVQRKNGSRHLDG